MLLNWVVLVGSGVGALVGSAVGVSDGIGNDESSSHETPKSIVSELSDFLLFFWLPLMPLKHD